MGEILTVCREYTRDLGWWDSLGREERSIYLADSRRRRQHG